MFITISTDKVIKTDQIIGIFDLDTASQTKTTKNFIKLKEKQGKLIMTSPELPKSFIVMKDGTVFFSQFSAKILKARTKYVVR